MIEKLVNKSAEVKGAEIKGLLKTKIKIGKKETTNIASWKWNTSIFKQTNLKLGAETEGNIN